MGGKDPKKSKTLIAMGIALAVALWQYYCGPLPMVDDRVFTMLVTVVGIGLRFKTSEPLNIAKLLGKGNAAP